MNERDEVARWIAANRFPFPDQRDWPAAYVTITNVDGPVRGISHIGGTSYPEIVIIDGTTQRVAEIGTVIDTIPADATARWSAFSDACKHSSTGARSFFVYAPFGLDAEARRVLDERGISYAGVRSYRTDAESVIIAPLVTPGDANDHR